MSKTELIQKYIMPLIYLFLGWVAKYIFDKYFLIRPRIYFHLSKIFNEHSPLGNDFSQHKLIWRHECTLINNSEYAAYNITVYEAKCKKSRKIIDNKEEINRKFPKYNYLEKNEKKEFEIKTFHITEPDELLNFTIENGEKVYIPGFKISSPEIHFRPKELEDIKLIVKYKNSKGNSFYTKLRKKDNIEKNSFHFFRPYWFFKIN